MKNWIKSMFIVLCSMMAVSTFVACGSDDDDDNGNNGSTSSIVGTWKGTRSESAEGKVYTWEVFISLKSDHTGEAWVIDPYSSDDERKTFTWTLNDKTLKIVPVSGFDDDDIITTFTIVSISKTTLVIYNGERNYSYTRVK